MEVNIQTRDRITFVQIVGDIDSDSAPQVQAQVLPLAQANNKVILDMGRVGYMSSAGLRLLLLLHREINARQGQVALAGLKAEIKDTMSLTGFLNFFTVYATVEAARTAFQ